MAWGRSGPCASALHVRYERFDDGIDRLECVSSMGSRDAGRTAATWLRNRYFSRAQAVAHHPVLGGIHTKTGSAANGGRAKKRPVGAKPNGPRRVGLEIAKADYT